MGVKKRGRPAKSARPVKPVKPLDADLTPDQRKQWNQLALQGEIALLRQRSPRYVETTPNRVRLYMAGLSQKVLLYCFGIQRIPQLRYLLATRSQHKWEGLAQTKNLKYLFLPFLLKLADYPSDPLEKVPLGPFRPSPGTEAHRAMVKDWAERSKPEYLRKTSDPLAQEPPPDNFVFIRNQKDSNVR
jgi:hypothetical protein